MAVLLRIFLACYNVDIYFVTRELSVDLYHNVKFEKIELESDKWSWFIMSISKNRNIVSVYLCLFGIITYYISFLFVFVVVLIIYLTNNNLKIKKGNTLVNPTLFSYKYRRFDLNLSRPHGDLGLSG